MPPGPAGDRRQRPQPRLEPLVVQQPQQAGLGVLVDPGHPRRLNLSATLLVGLGSHRRQIDALQHGVAKHRLQRVFQQPHLARRARPLMAESPICAFTGSGSGSARANADHERRRPARPLAPRV